MALVLLILLLASAPAAHAWQVTLEWGAPTESADGSPLTDLHSYRVYMDRRPIPDDKGDAILVAEVLDGTTATVEAPLSAPQLYFRATAVDTSGNESALSNEVMAQLDTVPPTTVIIRLKEVLR